MRHIINFYRYNSDVRKKYLDAFEDLPWHEIIRDRGGSFHSMRNIFLHVLDAYRYWLEYGIKDDLKQYTRLDGECFKNVDDMRRYELTVDSLVTTLVEGLTEEDLSTSYSIHDGNEIIHATMEAILMHMIEEELQHRGELNCMFWQQDIDPPITGYVGWLQEKTTQRPVQPEPKKAPWLTVTSPVKALLGQGKLRREYPDQPLVGVGAAIIDGSRILLVRRGQDPGRGLWSIPGGLIELGEKVRDAMLREVKEETGLEIQIERLLDVADSIFRDEQERIHFHYVVVRFLARPVTTLVEPRSDVFEAKWVEFNDIARFPLTEGAEKLVRTFLGSGQHRVEV